MGKAIIVAGADFSQYGYGRVTRGSEAVVPIEGITVAVDGTTEGKNTIQPRIEYSPVSTTQKGVTWSFLNGTSIDGTASIDATTGLITVLTESTKIVTIKATSNKDATLTDTLSISVRKASESESGGESGGSESGGGSDTPSTPQTSGWLLGINGMDVTGYNYGVLFAWDKMYCHYWTNLTAKTDGKVCNKVSFNVNTAGTKIDIYKMPRRTKQQVKYDTIDNFTTDGLLKSVSNTTVGWNEVSLGQTIDLDDYEIVVFGKIGYGTLGNAVFVGADSYSNGTYNKLQNTMTLLYDLGYEE